MTSNKCCLFIGNTRWHWGFQTQAKWIFEDTFPNSNQLKENKDLIWKWGAVGPVPANSQLDPNKCIKIEEIPLLKLPEWIGLDRALASWAAFQKAKSANLHSEGILIADAGTILSLTRITAKGEFAGGQLIPGLQLQRSAMSNRSEKLSPVKSQNIPTKQFPSSTEEAMLRGSFQALLGALLEAQKEASMPLWLCGGDSKILFDHLKSRNVAVYHHPNLVLEAMIKINC
ncbi:MULTISPECIES: type III pantothenate kinase [unclassified Prochlorococcus]|uniref:type III pantothenate kinase n=1 Tax=unclassified Prochlorococcus TaxID=2627481 RepID=UPI000533B002|nr:MULTISPECIES: type III pantothenate kinase [unclassified Prochlorococcus]KGG16861.1 Pantothenate kinase type III [Prochlorococcus sp. MIT 0602]KGG18165.1 Pantothenate kinase type III [Prochlorococcus sp. MIT 0603]